MRRGRRRTIAAVAAVGFVAVLAFTIAPAAGQVVESFDPAAVAGGVDPASIVDLETFAARAQAWSVAQVGHRQASIIRAEALAAETKAAEAAEEARIEEQEATRRQAEEQARAAAEAASATTTTTLATGADGSDAATIDDSTTSDESSDDGLGVAPPDNGPTPEQWHALRQCESGNNYRAISSTGRYRGAYQFSITTWNWLAGSQYPALVGVDPIDASVADQDRMAYALYAIYGASPWPVCGAHLL